MRSNSEQFVGANQLSNIAQFGIQSSHDANIFFQTKLGETVIVQEAHKIQLAEQQKDNAEFLREEEQKREQRLAGQILADEERDEAEKKSVVEQTVQVNQAIISQQKSALASQSTLSSSGSESTLSRAEQISALEHEIISYEVRANQLEQDMFGFESALNVARDEIKDLLGMKDEDNLNDMKALKEDFSAKSDEERQALNDKLDGKLSEIEEKIKAQNDVIRKLADEDKEDAIPAESGKLQALYGQHKEISNFKAALNGEKKMIDKQGNETNDPNDAAYVVNNDESIHIDEGTAYLLSATDSNWEDMSYEQRETAKYAASEVQSMGHWKDTRQKARSSYFESGITSLKNKLESLEKTGSAYMSSALESARTRFDQVKSVFSSAAVKSNQNGDVDDHTQKVNSGHST